VHLRAFACPFPSSAVFFQFLFAVLVSRRAFLQAFASGRFVSGAFSCREKTRRTVFLILNFGFLPSFGNFEFFNLITGSMDVSVFAFFVFCLA
jgi:hypothetical protein